jgi:hypothetical protein
MPFQGNGPVVMPQRRWKWLLSICWAGALGGMLCAPAWADFKTGKTHGGDKIPVSGPEGSQVTLITTGRAKSGQEPPEIKTHEQVIGKKGLTFNVPKTEEDSSGTQQTVVDYKLQVIPPGAKKLQFSLDVESFAPLGRISFKTPSRMNCSRL